MLGIVIVGAGEPDRQRQAATINEQMMLAAAFPAVGGIGTDAFSAEGGRYAGSVEAAALPVDLPGVVQAFQEMSVQPFPDPAARHSWRRRRKVMPLPQPISYGKSSH